MEPKGCILTKKTYIVPPLVKKKRKCPVMCFPTISAVQNIKIER